MKCLIRSFRTLIMELVEDNQKLNVKEFTVSVELLLAFVRYKQRFSTFFIMCESLPEEYAIVKMGKIVNEAQKKSFVKSGEIYLTKLASNLLKFLKQCRRLQDDEDAQTVLSKVFSSIGPERTNQYREILNDGDVRKLVKSVSRADEIFMSLVVQKSFKTTRCYYLVNKIVERFCDQKIASIRTEENSVYIYNILKNV